MGWAEPSTGRRIRSPRLLPSRAIHPLLAESRFGPIGESYCRFAVTRDEAVVHGRLRVHLSSPSYHIPEADEAGFAMVTHPRPSNGKHGF